MAANVSIIPDVFLSAGEGFYSFYSKVKWYREFMQELNHFFSLANETNDFHINNDNIDESPYRTIRYNYDELDSNYNNEHRIIVFTDEEHQFLESFKLLRQFQQQLPDCYKIQNLFSCLQQIRGLKDKAMEMLSDYEIEKGLIKRSTNLHDFIPFIKNIIYYFPEIKDDVQEALKHLPLHILFSFYESISSVYTESIESTLDFQNDILKIREFLNSKIKILHAIHSCTSLGIAIIYNHLLRISNYTDWKQHIFFCLKNIFYLSSSLFIEFLNKIQNKYVVVIECSIGLTDKDEEFIKDLLENVKNNGNIKVAFVTERNSPFNAYVKEYTVNNGLSYQQSDIEFKFSDLSLLCQNRLLDTTVICNGKETQLRLVLGIHYLDYDKIIDSDIIIKLIKNEIIKIGDSLPDLGSVEYYYIFRQFVRNVKIQKDIFRIHKNNIFIVSTDRNDMTPIQVDGTTVSNIQDSEEEKFLILSNGYNGEDDFKKYCKKYQDHNIHWLRKENDYFIWQMSRAARLSKYHKYIANYDGDISEASLAKDDTHFEIIDSDDINKFNEKIVIIAAEPGMGKSTVLKHLGNSITRSKLCFWLNLVEHKIEDVDFNTDDDVISFLLRSNNTTSDTIATKIIKHCFNSNNCIILLDGFDELLETGQNSLLNLLKKLQSTNIGKVFISTRLHLRDKLEDAMSTFAYKLKPFSDEDQKQFLKKFWQRDIDSDIEHTTLDKYISELLEFLTKSIRDEERIFMGIPLQMRMVAKSFRDELGNSLYSMQYFNTKPSFPRDFDVLKLYDCFIDNKYKIYFEKIGGGKIDLSAPDRKYLLTSGLTSLHAKLAFEELFPYIDDKMKKYLVGKQPISEISKRELNLVGIFQYINERVVFTHRTFAEYFIANILVRRLNSKHENTHKYAIEFLSKELFESKNEVIKTFLDYHLAKEGILAASLKGDLNSVRNITDINLVDALGRNGLHYAVQEGHNEIIDVLLQRNVRVDLKDKLGKTVLHYAARYNEGEHDLYSILKKVDTDFINDFDKSGYTALYYATLWSRQELTDSLIRMGAKFNAFDLHATMFHYIFENNIYKVSQLLDKGGNVCFREPHGNSLLHAAAKQGHTHIIKLLLEKGANKSFKNNIGKKAINLAAENKHWDAVELLIEDDILLSDLSEDEKAVFLKRAIVHKKWNIVNKVMKDKS